MECADWLDKGLSSADARFLMLTAITHHRFSSPVWGEDGVSKLSAELAEIDLMAAQAFADHDPSRARQLRVSVRSLP